MHRSLIITLLGGLGLVGVGCAQHASGLVAEAPSSHLSGRVPSTGHYTLYRVTHSNAMTSSPTAVNEVASYDLQEGEHIGFEWDTDPQTVNSPDGQLILVALAGSNRRTLGPILTRQEKYFWATGPGFNNYWTWEPVNGFARRVTLQD